MIVFKTLSWKNFLSTGMNPTVVSLDKASTTLVLGPNGSGKSTMLDALCYVLFKKPFRKIKKDQIINTINSGGCEVEVTFEVGTHAYRVRRGIKPDFFEIYENGNLEPRKQEAARKDDQKFLEEDVLKVNYDSFTQVVILGNAKYTPFMQLKVPERREFIEHILDIGVFSNMNDVLKVKQSALKEVFATNQKDLELAQEQIDMVAGFIDKLQEEQRKATEDTERQIEEQTAIVATTAPEIETLTTDIEALTECVNMTTKKITAAVSKKVVVVETEAAEKVAAIEKQRVVDVGVLETQLKREVAVLRAAMQDQTTKIDDELEIQVDEQTALTVDTTSIEEELRKLGVNKGAIQNGIAQCEAKIEFYTSTTQCKTCKQQIDTTFRDNLLVTQTTKLAEFKKGMSQLESKLQSLTDSIIDAKATNKSIQDTIRRFNLEASKKKSGINAATQDQISEVTDTTQKSIREINTTAQSEATAKNSQARLEVQKLKLAAEAEITEKTADDKIDIATKTTDLHQKRTILSTAHSLIKKLEADNRRSPGNIQEQINKRDELVSKFVELDKARDEAVQTRHYYDVAAVLLKDTGIKAAIIKQYLPMINKLVNKYLVDLDFYLSFSLDENFEESFKSRHRDTLQYNSFSEGEKLRIDLALLLAWREIARMKNSCSTNLLILDEVIDSSLDHNGTDFFIKMLNELGASSNVFVISHKNDAALDKFRDVMRFEKTKGFSHLVETL